VIQHAIGRPDFGGSRRIGVHHDFQQCRDRGAGRLLKAGDRLSVGGAAGLPVSCLELRQLHPFQQRVGRNIDCARSFINVALNGR
jgi:hypothetical protein